MFKMCGILALLIVVPCMIANIVKGSGVGIILSVITMALCALLIRISD